MEIVLGELCDERDIHLSQVAGGRWQPNRGWGGIDHQPSLGRSGGRDTNSQAHVRIVDVVVLTLS